MSEPVNTPASAPTDAATPAPTTATCALSAIDSHTVFAEMSMVAGYVRDLNKREPLEPEAVEAAAERVFDRWTVRVPVDDIPADYALVTLTSTKSTSPCPISFPATSPTSSALLPAVPASYFHAADVKDTMANLATANAPFVSLHVTTFSDRHFVGFALSHAVMDGEGFGAFVAAVQAELNGEGGSYPVPELEVGKSRFDEAVERLTEETKHDPDASPVKAVEAGGIGAGSVPVTAWRIFGLVRWGLWETYWYGAHEASAFLGRDVVKWLADKTKAEVVAQTGGQEYVSTGDVLWAWLLKAAYTNEPNHAQVRVLDALGVRTMLGLDKTFRAHSTTFGFSVPAPPSPHHATLADLALYHRRTLLAVRTPLKLAAFVNWVQSFHPGPQPLFLAMGFDSWFLTNQVEAGLGKALDSEVYYYKLSPKSRHMGMLASAEVGDGYVWNGVMRKSRWASVGRELDKLQVEYEAAVGGGEEGRQG